MQYRFGQENGV